MRNAGGILLKCVFVFFILVWIGIACTGCRSAKQITTAISKKDTLALKTDTAIATMEDLHADSVKYIRELYSHLQSNLINCNTFSAKLKVHYEGSNGKDYEFNAFIRLQKDKMIWISINATLLGIEAFRALITPDSVKVINKMDKIYQLRTVSYLKEITQLPFDFDVLQSIILGNPIYLDSNILYYRKEDQGISIFSSGKIFRNYLTLNKEDLSLKHSKLVDADPMRARYCDIAYSEYENGNNIHFSTFRKITIAEKARLDIEMNFKQYSFNENLNFPFSVPKNYKRK